MKAITHIVLCALLISSAAAAQPATRAATGPATRPATTRASTKPATKPATKPDPLATPVSAVEHFFKLLKAEDFVGLRDANLQPTTPSEMREKYAPVIRQMRAGTKFSVLDTHTSGSVSLAICKSVTAADETKAIFTVLLFNRFDRWKIEFGQPNMRRLTPGERDSLTKVVEWENTRVKALREKLLDKPAQ